MAGSLADITAIILLMAGVVILETAGEDRILIGGGSTPYKGCYPAGALNTEVSVNRKPMTRELCQQVCQEKNFLYYGIEKGTNCFCGNTILRKKTAAERCSKPCHGNGFQICGGDQTQSVFRTKIPERSSSSSSSSSEEDTTSKPKVFNYEENYLGCFLENGDGAGRALQEYKPPTSESMTRQHCRAACEQRKYQFFGVENRNECFCGDKIHTSKVSEQECKMPCNGDNKQICGGYWRISIYKTALRVIPVAPSFGIPRTDISQLDAFNYEVNYLGCYLELSDSRALREYRLPDSGKMTRQYCRTACEARGHKFFGLENMVECYCGNEIHNVKALNNDCNSPCSGDTSQKCGGSWRISIYRTALIAISDNPFNYEANYLGCYMEQDHSRALREYRHPDSSTMTRQYCRAACEQGRHKFFGVENTKECFCGNEIHQSKVADQECYNQCTGDNKQICGGPWRISIYRTALNEKAVLK